MNLNKSDYETDKIDEKLFPNICKADIVTYGGGRIDPVHPDVESISITDIAHALSNMCRYGGHCPRFYSVAEHSVYVMDLLPRGSGAHIQLAALLHDAEEAYLPDIPTPIKRQMPEYSAWGENLRKLIYKKYGVDWYLYDEIKPYDVLAYNNERKRLWNGEVPMHPEDAEDAFLEEFMRLYGTL